MKNLHVPTIPCVLGHARLPSLGNEAKVNSLRMVGPCLGFGGSFCFVMEVVCYLASPCCYFYLESSSPRKLIKILIFFLLEFELGILIWKKVV